MKNDKRLRLLEESAAKERERALAEDTRWTSEKWHQFFEQAGRDGLFDAEPDFPRALAELRDAMGAAKRSTDPPWDPPEDFMNENTSQHSRLIFWRDWQNRFPKVEAAISWLENMLERIDNGIPPVGEVEFTMLADWFNANLDRINGLARTELNLIDLGDGRSQKLLDFKWMICQGYRDKAVNEIFEDLRKLKALLDGGTTNGRDASVPTRGAS